MELADDNAPHLYGTHGNNHFQQVRSSVRAHLKKHTGMLYPRSREKVLLGASGEFGATRHIHVISARRP
jgi:hypothetical protein